VPPITACKFHEGNNARFGLGFQVDTAPPFIAGYSRARTFIFTSNLVVWQSILAILAEDYFLLSGERNDNFL